MGYAGFPNMSNAFLFGDGGDGDLHLQTNATIAKARYDLASLEIDAGVVWSAPQWWVDLIPVIEIRCLTAVILNGEVRADGVSGANSHGSIVPTGGGRPGSANSRGYGVNLIAANCDDQDYTGLYNICGAGNSSYPACPAGMWVDWSLLPGYADGWAQNPEDIKTVEPDTFVGRDRPFRFAVGGGGSKDSGGDGSGGGSGGGILLIKAPAVVFGSSAKITARGEDASADGTNHDAGGGGGGHVEIWTRTPLSGSDRSRCQVAGGAGDANGYAGLDGVRIFEVV